MEMSGLSFVLRTLALSKLEGRLMVVEMVLSASVDTVTDLVNIVQRASDS